MSLGRMPMLGLGTYKMLDAALIKGAIAAALDAGYRLIDTAQVYENEAAIGSALQELLPARGLCRGDLFLTTKLGTRSMDAELVLPSLRESLAKLRTDYVDLFLVHYPKPADRDPQDLDLPHIRREVWSQMEAAKREGLAREVGVSNYEPRHLHEMTVPPAVNQCEFHPHFTRTELRKECLDRGIHFQAFTSLGRNNPALVNDETLKDIAAAHHTSPQIVLLAWAICQGVSVIPKSSRPEVIEANFGALSLKLSQDEIRRLSSLNRNKAYTQCKPWEVE